MLAILFGKLAKTPAIAEATLLAHIFPWVRPFSPIYWI